MGCAGKARRRVLLAGGCGEEEQQQQHSRRRCNGDQKPAYLWKKVLRKSLFVLFLFPLSLSARSVDVPLDHRVYDLLDRWETRGFLPGLKNGSLPFSRKTCAKFIAGIDSVKEENPDIFSRVEKQLLERLKGEFFEELQGNKKIRISHAEKEPHFYSLSYPDAKFHADVLMGASVIQRSEEAQSTEQSIKQPYYGAILRGRFHPIAFFTDNRIYTEWGSRSYYPHYKPSEGYPIGAEHDSSRATWDVSTSYLAMTVWGIDVKWGRDRVKWGPGETGLMLSGQAKPMDLLQARFNFGPAVFTWLHGELRSDFSHRWIAAHRLEISFRPNLDIGLSESVIYGRRGIEQAYMNPVLPYLVAEHTLGDRDNVAMGFDLDWRPVSGFKVYLETLIDDLFAPWEIFGDFYGNKLAFTVGSVWTDPLNLPDTGMRVEYTRIEPFVYTHEDSVNVFEHYDQGLGHFLHPNADRFRVTCTHQWTLTWASELLYERTRQGDGNRRISDISRSDDVKRFLDGPVEKTRRYGISVLCEARRDLFLKTALYLNTAEINTAAQNHRAQWMEGLLALHWNW